MILNFKEMKEDLTFLINWLLFDGLIREKIGFIALVILLFFVYVSDFFIDQLSSSLLVFPFLTIFYLFFMIPWLNEGKDILNWKHSNSDEISAHVNTRIFLPLIIVIIFQALLLLVLLFVNFFMNQGDLFIQQEGLIIFVVSVIIFDLFVITLTSWISVKFGNFLKIAFHKTTKHPPKDITPYQKLRLKKISAFSSPGGMFLLLALSLILLIIIFPEIIVYFSLDQIQYLGLSAIVLPILKQNYYIWVGVLIVINIILMVLSFILRSKTITYLRNFPDARLTIPTDLKVFIE